MKAYRDCKARRSHSVNLLEAGWLAAAVVLPLLINQWGAAPVELPKAVFLRGLALLLILVATALATEGRLRSLRSPLRFSQGFGSGQGSRRLTFPSLTLRTGSVLGPAFAFGLAIGLATLFSYNPRLSLWGSYVRQQGLLTQLSYLILFSLVATQLHTQVQAARLLKVLSWTSIPVVAYGLLQALRLDPLPWRTDAASPVLSTLGRANFLGSYLVLVIPLTLSQALVACRRTLYLLLLAGQFSCLGLTLARGAWLGFVAMAGTFALILRLPLRLRSGQGSGQAWAWNTRRWQPVALTLGMLVAIIGGVALLNVPGGPLAPLARWPGLERLATIARTDSGSSAARLTIWKATLPLVVARPWLGYGPETMHLVFASVFPPQLVYYQGRQLSVDRAHNLALDMAMSTGLAGAGAFAILMVALSWWAWRRLRTCNEPCPEPCPERSRRGSRRGWESITWTAIMAAVIGHLVDLQVALESVATATVFWLLLGLATAMGQGLSMEPGIPGLRKPRSWLPYGLPALLAMGLFVQIGLRPLLADSAFWRAQQEHFPLVERLKAAETAVQWWPMEPTYWLGLARLHQQKGAFEAAEEQALVAERLDPDNPRSWAALGDLYARWGEVEPGRLVQAEAAYRRALALAPNVAVYHAALGDVLGRLGRLTEGVAALERAVALDATDAMAFRSLSPLYRRLGWEAKAAQAEEIARILETTLPLRSGQALGLPQGQ